MRKIIIDHRYYGSIELPDTPNAIRIFTAVKHAFSQHKKIGLHLLFGKRKLSELQHYQNGGAWQELEEISMFIQLGEILNFDTKDALKLKNEIEQINDTAHTYFNISKRLALFNKEQATPSMQRYIFWDIENFANIPAMFNHVIDVYDVPDEHIYMAANPDSLYIYKREWESELYDYGKTLNSFNFTKCDHGKNVADDVLLTSYEALHLQNCDIFVMTYDRELKERFLASCHPSNNMYVMNK